MNLSPGSRCTIARGFCLAAAALLGTLVSLHAGAQPDGTPAAPRSPATTAAEHISATRPAPADPRITAIARAVPRGVADLKALEKQVQAALEPALAATVAAGPGSGFGSATLVGSEGYCFTAAHVVRRVGGPALLAASNGRRLPATVLGAHWTRDVSLLRLDRPDRRTPCAAVGDAAAVVPGQWCLALGFPSSSASFPHPVVRLGRVVLLDPGYIATDCTLNSGDSGGSLYDLQGRLIGVNSSISRGHDLAFHVPVRVFREHWDTLASGGQVGTNPYLGRPAIAGPNGAKVPTMTIRGGIPAGRQRDAEAVMRALAPVAALAWRSAARVRCNGKDAALATVVAADGLLLTLASALSGEPACTLADGRSLPARVVASDAASDLALLKVDAAGLTPVAWSEDEPPGPGRLVVTLGPGSQALAWGVVSVPVRRVAPRPPPTFRWMPAGSATAPAAARPAWTESPVWRVLAVGAFQHDTQLKPTQCGGVLVDLDGKAVGVNVFRGEREQTLALPAGKVRPLLTRLLAEARGTGAATQPASTGAGVP